MHALSQPDLTDAEARLIRRVMRHFVAEYGVALSELAEAYQPIGHEVEELQLADQVRRSRMNFAIRWMILGKADDLGNHAGSQSDLMAAVSAERRRQL